MERAMLVTSKRFLESARDLGLTTVDAVCELVDNGLDAGATRIGVHVERAGKNLAIIVEDDGAGIPIKIVGDRGKDVDGIGYALSFGGRAGSDTPGVSIGKFGWGLSSAAVCQSRRTEVYSRTKGEPKWRLNYIDLAELENSGSIQLDFSQTVDLPKHLQHFNRPHGTIVVLADCDNPDFKTEGKMAGELKKHLGLKYRRYIVAGRAITVDGSELVPRDPLFLTPDCFDSDKIPIAKPYADIAPIEIPEVLDENGDPEKVRVKVVLLDVDSIRRRPDWSPKWMAERGLNQKNQGFYLMRNDRQISEALTLDLFTRHPGLSYFRGEISFSPALDRYFGIQTNKNKFTLRDGLKDQIKQALGNVIHHMYRDTLKIVKDLEKEREQLEAKESGPTRAERVAAKAAKLLKRGRRVTATELAAQEETLAKEKASQISGVLSDNSKSEEAKASEIREIEAAFHAARIPFRIVARPLHSGAFFETHLNHLQVQLVINQAHEFYNLYQRATESPREKLLLDLLLLSAAHGESQFLDDPEKAETASAIKAFRREWSITLGAVLEKLSEEAPEEPLHDGQIEAEH